MDTPSSGGYVRRRLGLTVVATLCLAGCSGGGPPGSHAGSTTQMRRQMESATAARIKAGQAARKAVKPPAADAPSETTAEAKPAVKSKPKAKKRVTATALPSTAPSPTESKPLPSEGPPRRIALSADGSLAAIDGEDGSVRLMDTNSGSSLAAWPGRGKEQSALAIDPARCLVAAASVDGPIRLVRYGSKKQEGFDHFARLRDEDFDPTLRGHRGRVNALSFDRDGERLISAGEDGTVRAWRLSSAAPLAVAVGESRCAPAFDPDGKMIAVATADHAVEALDLHDARGSRRLQRHKAPITAVAFGHAKDLDVLVSADEKGRIHVWDFHADRDQELVGHAATVTGLAFDETRRRIISTSIDGSLRIAPYPASKSQLLAKLSGPPASLALTADQQYVALNVGPASVSVIPLAGDGGPQSSSLRGESFTACAIARDGEVLLAGTVTGSVVGQSRQDGAAIVEFTGAKGAIHALAVHPDGKRFSYSGDDGVIRIGRLPDPEHDKPDDEGPLAIEAHSGPVRSMAFTPEGQTLISAGADNVVRLWNLAEYSELDSFPTQGVEPTIVCGTQNAAAVVVACGKKTVLVWNRDARKPASRLPLRGEVRSLALAQTGTLAIGMADGDIQLWDIDRQLEIERLSGHTEPVDHLVFAGDTRLVSASADRTVRLWSLSRTRILQAHQGAVRGIAVSEENGRIVTGGDDRRLCLWSHDGDLLRDDDLHLRITGLALHPRRPQVAFLTDDSFKSSEVSRWNLDEAAFSEPLRTPSPVKALAYGSDGKKLAVAGTDNMLRIYDTQTDTLLEEIPAVTGWASVGFGTDDNHLIATETDNVVRTYPLRLYRCFQFAASATCAALSADSEFLLSGAQDGDVKLWSLHSNRLQHQMQVHASPIAAVSFSGDGKKAFSADLGGTVRVWSLEDASAGKPIDTDQVLDHPGAVRSLQASTSGATLITGCDDGVTRVWDVSGAQTKDGVAKIKESYTGQALPVVGVRLVNIERSLLTCNRSGILNLWNRPTEAEIAKGASSNLALATAKSADLTAVSAPPPANDHEAVQDSSQVAALAHLLRTARIPAERDVWRKKIQSAAEPPSEPADRPFVSAKLVPRGHVPPSEIGKGEPWDLSVAAELKTHFPFDGTTHLQIEMAVSSDGKLVAATPKRDARGGMAALSIWDVPTGLELRRWESIPAGRWQALSFAGSNDGFLYTSPDATTFELSTGKANHFADDCLPVPMGKGDRVLFGRSTSPVAASPLLTLIEGGRFHKEWSGLMGYDALVTALACSRDGHWAAVGVRERLRHKLVLFDLREMQVASVLDEAPHAKPWSTEGPIGISDTIFSPDGKRLFWHGQYGPDDFRATTAVATPNGFNVPEKSIVKLKQGIPTNRVIGYVAGQSDALYLGTKTGLVLCESKSGKVTSEIKLTQVHSIKSEGDQTKTSETKGAEAKPGNDRAGSVQYVVSADGAWMASADDGGKVVLWDLTTPRRPCNTFAAHTGPIVGLRFSFDNQWLATAGEENRIRLWNLAELQDRRQRPTARKAGARP